MTSRDPQETPYDSWAAYYDVTDADRTPFIEFYRGLVTVRTRSLLDLGCGTGTVTIALVNEMTARGEHSGGIRVVGIDESPEMLTVARERDSSVEWIVGDMRSPPVEGHFDLVISSFNSLQLLHRDRDLVATMRAVRGLIEGGGHFAFDIYQPNAEYLAADDRDRLARAVRDARGRALEIREDTEYDSATRVLTVDWRLVETANPQAAPLARMRCGLRQYFADEVEAALSEAGLAIHQRYGEFDRSPFTPQSRKQILVCGAA